MIGLLDEPTFLREGEYANLFVPYGPTIWRQRHTYTYRIPTKQVWSITPCFPENSHVLPTTNRRYIKSVPDSSSVTDLWIFRSNKRIVRVIGQKRHAMLFNTIVLDTRAVAIGPLEYCGNGRVIKLPHGKTLYVLPTCVLLSCIRHLNQGFCCAT